MEHAHREVLKTATWKLYVNSVKIEDKVLAIELTVISHYYRSLESHASGHPDYHTYACNWIPANALNLMRLWSNDESEKQAVYAELVRKYPSPDSLSLATGNTHWGS